MSWSLEGRKVLISAVFSWAELVEFEIMSLITTKVVSSNTVHGEVYSMQHYVIKVVSDLRQVGGFLRVLQFPPPIKLTTKI
jgi:hypothetical protein